MPTQKAWEAARALAEKGVTLTLEWVPSHQGTYGNETADLLAKKGLEMPPKKAYTSMSYLRRQAKKQEITDWKANWDAQIQAEKHERSQLALANCTEPSSGTGSSLAGN